LDHLTKKTTPSAVDDSEGGGLAKGLGWGVKEIEPSDVMLPLRLTAVGSICDSGMALFARVGSLERVMQPPEAGPQTAFRYRRAPRHPTGELPASGDLNNSARLSFSWLA